MVNLLLLLLGPCFGKLGAVRARMKKKYQGLKGLCLPVFVCTCLHCACTGVFMRDSLTKSCVNVIQLAGQQLSCDTVQHLGTDVHSEQSAESWLFHSRHMKLHQYSSCVEITAHG